MGQRSLKVIETSAIRKLGCGFLYSPSIVTMAVSVAVCEIFSVNEWRDLENQVRGRSRSLKMAPFDRPYATFYWSTIVNIALSCAISSYLTLNNIVLKIGVRGHSRSLKLVPFESLDVVFYSPSLVTVTVSVPVCEIFSVKEWCVCYLENRVRVRSRSLEMASFDRSHTSFCSPSILTMAIFCIVCEI